jgi:hypothetical protein
MARSSKATRSLLFAFVLAALTLFTVGCGSNSSSSSGTRIRFVNAAPLHPTVNVLIDGTTVATALADGGGVTAYLPVAAGARHIQVQDPNSSPVIDTTPTINAGDSTYIIKDFVASPLILSDDNSAPTTGDFKLRAINLSPTLNAGVDAYVEVSTISSLNGLTATFSGLPFPPTTATYVSTAVGSGSWEVIFTPAGGQAPFYGTPTAMTFVAGQVETVLLVEDASGGETIVPLVDVQ